MQRVNIYINAYHTGHFKKGTGTYTIVLEAMKSDNSPGTKDYIGGIKGTSKNRTALIACIEAFHHMIKQCDITVTINSEYITEAINTNAWQQWLSSGKNAKGKPAKNLDLWQQLSDLMDKHLTEFIYSDKNQYTDWGLNEMKRRTIEYKEDLNNV